MADQVVILPSETTGAPGAGKSLDHSELTVATRTVQRQRLVVADDATAAALARVLSAAPAAGDYALVVRAFLYGTQSGGGIQPVRVDASGRQIVAGETADGGATSGAGNPVRTAGTDGTNIRTLLTDTSGRQFVRPSAMVWQTPARVAQNAAATPLVATNTARKALRIINRSTVELMLRLDAAAPVLTAGSELFHYVMPAGATLELLDGEAGTAQVQGIWASAGSGYAMCGEAQ